MMVVEIIDIRIRPKYHYISTGYKLYNDSVTVLLLRPECQNKDGIQYWARNHSLFLAT